MNNFEKIKSMDIEELALHLYKIIDVIISKIYGIPLLDEKGLVQIFKQWLESEVE